MSETDGTRTTIYDPSQTLKIGFPPHGSPLLDLKVCSPDLTVGVLQMLGRISKQLDVELHPDVAVALGAIEERLNQSKINGR